MSRLCTQMNSKSKKRRCGQHTRFHSPAVTPNGALNGLPPSAINNDICHKVEDINVLYKAVNENFAETTRQETRLAEIAANLSEAKKKLQFLLLGFVGAIPTLSIFAYWVISLAIEQKHLTLRAEIATESSSLIKYMHAEIAKNTQSERTQAQRELDHLVGSLQRRR